MSHESIATLSNLTGISRETVSKKLRDLPYEPGKRGAKLYNTVDALPVLYSVSNKAIDLNVARAELAVVQKEKIEMDMDLKQGSFVAVDEAEELVSRVFSSFRARTLSIPSKAVPLLQVATTQVKQMEVLQELVRDALEELSVPEEFTPVPRLVE